VTRVLARPAIQLAVLLGLCAVLYGFGLGSGGFIDTEGHRAVPGFEMLESGNWLVPHMFERPYLRKPPGMPWAIASVAALLGSTEFAARLVSALAATGSVVTVWWFGRTWFGRWGGLAAGLSQALTPWFWPIARHAEIEALNQFGTQLAALSLVHVMVLGGRWARTCALLGAIGTLVMLFAKGPAGLAVPGAVMVAACLVHRSIGPLWCTRVAFIWLPALGLFAWWTVSAGAWLDGYSGEATPVLQSPGSFMWADPIAEIGVLPAVAFLSALPGSLALLFPWGPDARREGTSRGGRKRPGYSAALTLGWAWVLSIALWWGLGIGNPRYTLPAAVLVAPLAGWVVRGLTARGPGRLSGKRPGIAELMLLRARWAWVAVLAGVWVGYLVWVEQPRRETSGRAIGIDFASTIASHNSSINLSKRPTLLFANGAIEARPEVLWAIENGLPEAPTRVVWRAINGVKNVPESGVYFLLRDDASGHEPRPIGVLNGSFGWSSLQSSEFHKYLCHLEFFGPTP